jgi:hypothetical protein
MTNLTIFKDSTAVSTGRGRESALNQTLASGGGTYRRIQTSTNGTFKRLVNGEQIGNAKRGDLDVVIVGALGKVSRLFYSGTYDPNADAEPPVCWSNLGDVPDPKAPEPQAASCTACPQNIKGSGAAGTRACRYQRRLAVLLAGDDSGDIYQINIPSKSLFGKGVGNVHPFESYVSYLRAHNEMVDTVVTNVSYDPEATNMELRFTPLRGLSDDEYAAVVAAQAQPEATNYTKITLFEKKGEAAEASPTYKLMGREEILGKDAPIGGFRDKVKSYAEPEDEEEEEVVAEPVKRASAKQQTTERPDPASLADKVADLWGDE